jgi:hypothetical protein
VKSAPTISWFSNVWRPVSAVGRAQAKTGFAASRQFDATTPIRTSFMNLFDVQHRSLAGAHSMRRAIAVP